MQQPNMLQQSGAAPPTIPMPGMAPMPSIAPLPQGVLAGLGPNVNQLIGQLTGTGGAAAAAAPGAATTDTVARGSAAPRDPRKAARLASLPPPQTPTTAMVVTTSASAGRRNDATGGSWTYDVDVFGEWQAVSQRATAARATTIHRAAPIIVNLSVEAVLKII